MKYFTRFQVYEDLSRQRSTQLGEDIPEKDLIHFNYGQSVRIIEEDLPATEWPLYRVANLPHIQQIPDPEDPSKKAMLIEVFLAQDEQWDQFDFPGEFVKVV